MVSLADRDTANALLAANGCSFRFASKLDWVDSALRGRSLEIPLFKMIKKVVKSKDLAPQSVAPHCNAVRLLTAPLPIYHYMNKLDAVNTLDFVAKKMVPRAAKRKREEDQEAALERGSDLVEARTWAAVRAAVANRPAKEKRVVGNNLRSHVF